MCSEIIQVLLRLRVDLRPRPIKQWLIETAVAQLPGQVADRGKKSAGHSDHPVEKRPEGFLGVGRQFRRAPDAALALPERALVAAPRAGAICRATVNSL